MKYLKAILIVFIAVLYSCKDDETIVKESYACENDNLVQKGERMIGIDLLDLTQTNSFDDNLKLASELGIEFIALHLAWTSIETSPNNYEDPGGALEALNQVAIANNLKFSLTIRPIDLTGKTVPGDLVNTRFNDAQMIQRFKKLTDFIFTKVNSSILLNFQIGNEIDGYDTSSEPATFWSDYGEFLNATTGYIHSINSEVKVGFTGILSGLLQQESRFKALMQNVDILGVTYYPLNSDFSVKDPDAVFTDLSSLTSMYGDFPIYLQEVGCQTSSENNSSEEKQAKFFCNFFKAWDIQHEHIKSANIVRLNDLSLQGATDGAGPYGISDNNFIEYLRTLGIRTYDSEGTNKKTFSIIKDNLSDRGW